MRTTINLDDDIHELASVYASARRITLGSAIGELVRKSQPSSQAESQMVIHTNGLPFFPPSGRTVTAEMVKSVQEDEFG